MYNEITKECACNRCSYSWRSRGEAPKVCPKCTSKLWNDGSRKFDYIIARACGPDPSGIDRQKFCIIDYIDNPNIVTEDVFYITREDLNKYLLNTRYPSRSALVFIGAFEMNEAQELKVSEMKLIFCQEPGFNSFVSSVNCLYNVKSYYERLKTQKLREEEAERLAAIKAEKERQLLEAARARIEEEAQKELQIEQAKRTISDESATTEERLKAVRLLEQAA